jgi:histidine ammonia-lyase
MERIDASAAAVQRIVAGGETVYGINTGFGSSRRRASRTTGWRAAAQSHPVAQLRALGSRSPRHVTRLMILLKLLGLGRGHSGVRREVIDALQSPARWRRDAGDPLAGLGWRLGRSCPAGAHDIGALMGHGWIDLAGENASGSRALERIGLSRRCVLGPKEGLALINGTQFSTAQALDALFAGERVFGAALAAGALSVDALKGSVKPFDARISALRGQPGQIRVAAAELSEPAAREARSSPPRHRCGRVQDPYSFRCQPQVMGAALDLLENAARTLTIEAGGGDRQSDPLQRTRTSPSPAAISMRSRSPSPPTSITMALVRGRLACRNGASPCWSIPR